MRARATGRVLIALGTLAVMALLTGSAQAAPAAVSIDGFRFLPQAVTVNAGETVTWTNQDPAQHTATAPGVFDTGTLAVGQSRTIRLDTAGTFEYRCAIHGAMTGTVRVVAVATPAPTPAPTAAPTAPPTAAPTAAPTSAPTPAPTAPPTPAPTVAPATAAPTQPPAASPTATSAAATASPAATPSLRVQPSPATASPVPSPTGAAPAAGAGAPAGPGPALALAAGAGALALAALGVYLARRR